mmetsp:Transcript_102684/g.329099  ORF Transcript_102684/g.329099 Transcript_102684/m.329099 type:complete len:322 (+) Transcript_102684:3976-4941(+)
MVNSTAAKVVKGEAAGPGLWKPTWVKSLRLRTGDADLWRSLMVAWGFGTSCTAASGTAASGTAASFFFNGMYQVPTDGMSFVGTSRCSIAGASFGGAGCSWRALGFSGAFAGKSAEMQSQGSCGLSFTKIRIISSTNGRIRCSSRYVRASSATLCRPPLREGLLAGTPSPAEASRSSMGINRCFFFKVFTDMSASFSESGEAMRAKRCASRPPRAPSAGAARTVRPTLMVPLSNFRGTSNLCALGGPSFFPRTPAVNLDASTRVLPWIWSTSSLMPAPPSAAAARAAGPPKANFWRAASGANRREEPQVRASMHPSGTLSM